MMDLVVPLADAQSHGLNAVGGKALNLSKLASLGFPTPTGVVVLASAYDRYLDENGICSRILDCLKTLDSERGIGVNESSARVVALIREGRISDELAQSLRSAVTHTGSEELWAVRSSAVAEDTEAASFAGQQDSFLNVSSDEVVDMVKACWASYWTPRAITYRTGARVDHLQSGMAVVVQRMVRATSSGIMFTVDPVNPDKASIVIESSWGLGEAIASGLVSPDRFVCDKRSLAIETRNVSSKHLAVLPSRAKGVATEVDPEKRNRPSLTDEQIKELAEAGRDIERAFGKPQDVEWAFEDGRLYILQSRPITTLDAEEETLWTRAYGDEYWADVTSPLFFSWLGDLLTEYVNHEGSKVMGYKNLTDKELLRVNKGHIYFNSSVLEEVFTYNPKFSRTKELLNYFPEKDQPRIANAETRVLRRLLAELRIALLDPDGMIVRTDRAYREWAADFLEKMKRFDALDLTRLSDGQLRDEFESMEKAYLKHYRLIRYGMVTHSIGMNLMVKRWLTDWLGDRSGVLYSRLVSGLPDNKTMMTNMALASLAKAAREDPLIFELLTRLSSEEFLKRMREDTSFEEFSGQFKKFLQEYGHRSHTREIFFPRWADDPRLVVDIVRTLAPGSSLDLESLEERRAMERAQTEQQVLKAISGLKWGLMKRILFKTILRYAQTYLIFRENQRFYLDHQIVRVRRLFLEYGRRYTERGLFSDPSDVFFLSKPEVFSLAAGIPPGLGHMISSRREEFERYRTVLPPKFLMGKTEFDDTVVREGNVTRLTGASASPGIVTGVVRVVDSIERLSEIRENEILVTSNTDPGWTAVFSRLGGLVTETGGILSHGAVVSREYGIPAVTAVKNATTIFKTGQKVTLDGNEGVIYIQGEG